MKYQLNFRETFCKNISEVENIHRCRKKKDKSLMYNIVYIYFRVCYLLVAKLNQARDQTQ